MFRIAADRQRPSHVAALALSRSHFGLSRMIDALAFLECSSLAWRVRRNKGTWPRSDQLGGRELFSPRRLVPEVASQQCGETYLQCSLFPFLVKGKHCRNLVETALQAPACLPENLYTQYVQQYYRHRKEIFFYQYFSTNFSNLTRTVNVDCGTHLKALQ